MQKIAGAGATAQNTFTRGDPATGVPATEVTQEWLNAMQGELVYIVEQAGLTLDSLDNTQVKVAIDMMIAAQGAAGTAMGGVPVGAAIPFFGGTVHAGFLKANGAVVSRAAYAALFAEIGTTYGVGDGSTTFNLPDSRGEFLRGLDDARGVDAGRVLGSWQVDAFKSHAHDVHGYALITPGTQTPWYNWLANSTNQMADNSPTTIATGGTETRPRNLAVRFLIKY